MLAQCGLLPLVTSTLALTAEETACDGSIACLARLRAHGQRVAPQKRCVVGGANKDCAFEWEPCGREELGSGRFRQRAAAFERSVLARFWPEPLLCRILAETAAEARACPPTPELFSMSHGRCFLDDNGTDAALRSRASYRTCARGVPVDASHVAAVEDRLRATSTRAGAYGDSVVMQLLWFWRTRLESLGRGGEPVLEEVGQQLAVDDFLAGGATTDAFGRPRAGGDGGTVLLFNYGLHAPPNKQPVYERDVANLFDDMERKCAAASKKGKPTVAVFVQTSAQHFETRTGGFFSKPRGWASDEPWDVPDDILTWVGRHGDLARPPPNAAMPTYPCRPTAHATTTERWRSDVAARAFAAKPYRYVHVLEFGQLTEALWDAHVGNIWEKHLDSMVADCTHFCYNPMLLEAFAYMLRRILDVADARAQEDAATPPPATTTGGGRPGAPPAGGASSTATPAGNATAAARAANATLAPTAKAATHRPTRFPPKRRKRHKGHAGD